MNGVKQETDPHVSVFFIVDGDQSVNFGGMLAYHGWLSTDRDQLLVKVHKNGAYDLQIDERRLPVKGNFAEVILSFQMFCRDDAERRIGIRR